LGFAAAPHDFALFQSDDLVTADSKFRKYLVGLFAELRRAAPPFCSAFLDDEINTGVGVGPAAQKDASKAAWFCEAVEGGEQSGGAVTDHVR
jgi:hypothetical protein